MFSLPQVLNQLQFIGYETALLGLFVTGCAIIIAYDWRFLILALLAQYILTGLMLSRLVRPDIALLEVLIGAFICPILFLSARQVAPGSSFFSVWGVPESKERTRFGRWWQNFIILLKGKNQFQGATPTGFWFRVFVSLLMILVAITVGESFPLPGLALSVTTAVYWLVLAGLTTLTLTKDPMKAGHGIFTALSGFGLLYTTLEHSLLLTGLWGTVNLFIALAIGYLTVVKGTGPKEEI